MSIVGVDLSLTATGYATRDGQGTIKTKPGDWKMRDGDSLRIRHIANELMDLTAAEEFARGVELVALEGFSFGSKGSALFQTAGLGYLVRDDLLSAKIPFVLIPPACVKRYATGKGNATKPDIRVAILQRWGIDVRDDNEADAFILRLMAIDHYDYDVAGNGFALPPATHREALLKIDWPPL